MKNLCLLSLFTLASAGSAFASPDDIILRPNARGGSVINEEDGAVIFRQCFPEDVTSRTCPTRMDSPRIPRQSYIEKLAASYQLDQGIVTLGSTDRLDREIKETEEAIQLGTLNPEEQVRAQEYLDKLRANEVRAKRLFKMVDYLVKGSDVVLNENFNQDFAYVVKPFEPLLKPSIPNATVDKINGIYWVTQLSASRVCWYDAMDVPRQGNCGNPVPGCAEKFGRVWRLPKIAEFAAAVTVGSLATCASSVQNDYCRYWTYEGNIASPYYTYDNGRTRYYVNEITGVSRSQTYNAVCMAKARDVDPYGDVDEDGIENYRDRCNRQRENPFDPVVLNDPARLGCTSYQTPDAE
jgi:hypothetical protein